MSSPNHAITTPGTSRTTPHGAPPAANNSSSEPAALTFLGGDLAIASAFLIEIDNTEIGMFREVTGLEVKIEEYLFNAGGQNSTVYKRPGRMSWTNIVLKRGVTQGNDLFEWFERTSGEQFGASGSKVPVSTGAIVALNFRGDRLRSWNLKGVWPVRWKGPSFNTFTSEKREASLEEELEVAHHGFTVETHPGKK